MSQISNRLALLATLMANCYHPSFVPESDSSLDSTGFELWISDKQPCGNDKLDEGEECDSAIVYPQADLHTNYHVCDVQTCTWKGGWCGDGVKHNNYEECDDGAANADDAGCTSMCTQAICGDGFLWAGFEDCDPKISYPNQDFETKYHVCNPYSCEWKGNWCGDGVLDTDFEGCDNGETQNLSIYGGCNQNCTLASHCGDGIIDHRFGEQCDDSDRNGYVTAEYSSLNLCTNDCKLNICGDGVPGGPNEECDDGNSINIDSCLNTCKQASCSDGILWIGVEECDDGNEDNSDACLSTCMQATCGDGFVRTDYEQCDDGNEDNSDACLSNCMKAGCGDGSIWSGVEECDPGINDPNVNWCGDSELGEPCKINKIVFVTEGLYDGDLGGLQGADFICQMEAENANLKNPWNFKAFLSTEYEDAKDRLNWYADRWYIGYEGFGDFFAYASSWSQLAYNGPLNPFHDDVMGHSVFDEYAWTATDSFGKFSCLWGFPGDCTCHEWTINFPDKSSVGKVDEKFELWAIYKTHSCVEFNHLYCFEQ